MNAVLREYIRSAEGRLRWFKTGKELEPKRPYHDDAHGIVHGLRPNDELLQGPTFENGISNMRHSTMLSLASFLAINACGAAAGEADVVDVSVRQTGENTYSFSVTVRHDDTGWDHYANRWQVLAPDGTVLGERVLLHPHETEQPFTRSLTGVVIPPEIDAVIIRAGDSVHEFGGKELRLKLPQGGD